MFNEANAASVALVSAMPSESPPECVVPTPLPQCVLPHGSIRLGIGYPIVSTENGKFIKVNINKYILI